MKRLKFKFVGQEFSKLAFEDIKSIKGYSGGFLLGMPSMYERTPTPESDVKVFCISSDLLRSNEKSPIDGMTKGNFLCSILFGRLNANGHYCLTKQLNTFLVRYLMTELKVMCSYEDLDRMGCDEYGTALEKFLCKYHQYKHGTEKQDYHQKIDVISKDNKRYQVKCSLICYDCKGSYSISNGSVFESEV